jgi:hypothetical protein
LQLKSALRGRPARNNQLIKESQISFAGSAFSFFACLSLTNRAVARQLPDEGESTLNYQLSQPSTLSSFPSLNSQLNTLNCFYASDLRRMARMAHDLRRRLEALFATP